LILSLSLQSTLRERGAGRGKFLYFSIILFYAMVSG